MIINVIRESGLLLYRLTRKYDSKLIEHAEARYVRKEHDADARNGNGSHTNRDSWLARKKNRQDRFICVTAITFRAPSSLLDYARWVIAYSRPGWEIWTPHEGSRYVRVHYGEWIQQRRFPSKASVLSSSRSLARVTLTHFVRQGRKFSRYTMLIVAPSRVFRLLYIRVRLNRDARPPAVCWNAIR